MSTRNLSAISVSADPVLLLDFGLISEVHDSLEDWGLITEAVDEADDFGQLSQIGG